MRIFKNFSLTEKILFAGIVGYAAFSFSHRFVNGPGQSYHFPEKNLAVFSLIKPDRVNCPNDDISRLVSQSQIKPPKELARYQDCGNKGYLTQGDSYADFHRCFYVFGSEFRQLKNCESSVPLSSLDMRVQTAKANRDYQVLLGFIEE